MGENMKRTDPWKVRCEVCESVLMPGKGYVCDQCGRSACLSCTLEYEGMYLCDKCAHLLPADKRKKMKKVDECK